MLAHQVYKLMHLTGVLMIFIAFGGLIVRSMLGEEGVRLRKFAGMTCGIGLLLALVGGFGLIAKLKYGFPGWVILKILIWFAMGGLVAVVNRKPELGRTMWWVVIGLGVVAAYLAGVKPF